MRYEFNMYRTSDRFLDISFLFVEISQSNWRAYILTDIDYKKVSRKRSDSISIVHRLTENGESMKTKIFNFIRENNISYNKEEIHYICWTTTVKSLEGIRELARNWSEITSYYIQHGGSFDTIQPKLKSKGII